MKRLIVTLLVLLLPGMPIHAALETASLPVGDETEMPVRHAAAAPARARLLWLPPEGGFTEAHERIAEGLAARGIDTWLADPFEANFLPPVASSIGRIPPEQIATLIARLAGRDGPPLFLLSSGYGIVPLLEGLRRWQRAHPDSTRVQGVFLMSAKFYEATPEPGRPARLLPVVRATNARIWLIQPRKSPWFWKLLETLPALREGGSQVWLQILPDLRDRFHYRPDATEDEQRAAERLPALLDEAIGLLLRLPDTARRPPEAAGASPAAPRGRQEARLHPWQGDPTPPPLRLPRLDGGMIDLRDLRGQVVLVNFWASWCPPCVHEMPSMEALAETLRGRPFAMLAVNMAEDEDEIRRFLREQVRFTQPVLLDRDGEALRAWGVFAFPTTYLLDHRGRIRYAVSGGVDWMQPEIRKPIEALLREAEQVHPRAR